MRIDRLGMMAGHGSSDPNYRPPRLPYISVVGPLNLELEPDRDPPRAIFIVIQSPGYLAGRDGMNAQVVPAPGTLHLRLDGDTRADVAIDFGPLAGSPLTDANARTAAALIETAIRAAVGSGGFSVAGTAVTDPARLAELQQTAVRWDSGRKRFVITSGRRGTRADPSTLPDATPLPVSRVETEPGASDLAPALGLRDGVFAADGRLARQKLATPTAIAVDIRLDLWAGSQQDLAALLEAWAHTTPTRTEVATLPALLAADVAANATQITLQREGDPLTRWSLLQLEPDGDFADRLSAEAPVLANGAALDARTLRLTGPATASLGFFHAPPIALPGLPEHPGPTGYALTVGVRADGPLAAGQTARLARLTAGARTVLQVTITISNGGPNLFADVTVAADQADGTAFTPVTVRLPAAQVTAGTDLHVVLDSTRFGLGVYADGAPLVPLVAVPELPAAVLPAGGYDLQLELGNPAGITLPVRITHLHLIGRPLGPPDPRLRRSLAAAVSWRIGDPINLVRTENGFTAAGEPSGAVVVGVDGDRLTLDRPLATAWRRASTLIYSRSLFYHQRQWRRADDIMNNLFRLSAEYRVSTFLDDPLPAVSAPLVERPEVEVLDLTRLRAERDVAGTTRRPDYPMPPAAASPSVRARIRSTGSSRDS
ncbi:MAG: hypothetical protein JSS43_24875 [Proteobacteria bacterium]|nr:hypothetical protein [Pseudomonadota bacterium]